MIKYYDYSVLEAAKRRVSYIFDEFKNIFVSVSSGKDSTVMYHLCLQEAINRNRKINLFFLDQEAEYQGTVEIMRKMMKHDNIIPHWYQVSTQMTNATSYNDCFLNSWKDGEEWMRPKEEIAIKSIDSEYPKRFYEFFEWFEQQQHGKTAFLIGLRSKESLNRFRAISKNAGYKNLFWSTHTKKENVYRFYPIYDWMFGDIWKYIADNKIKYNQVYNKMYCMLGGKANSIRISNLIHEKSFKCLRELQEIEPETYEKLCRRLNGVHAAAIYAKEKFIYDAKMLPKQFKTWKEYRDYLIESSPINDKYKKRMKKRFDGQNKTETIFQQQCKQILLNDWENNIPVDTKKTDKQTLIDKWWDLL